MVLFKLLLFVLLSASLNAKSGKVNFQTGGQWDRVLIEELPDAEKELRFFQLKDLDEFELELARDPFDELSTVQLVLLQFEFWCKFRNDEELFLKLQICDDEYSWPLESNRKQVVLKVFNESYIQSKENQTCLSKFNFTIFNVSNFSSAVEIDELNILHLAAFYSPVGLPVNGTSDLDDLDEAWNVIDQESTKRYECNQENCDSFSVNSNRTEIKNRKFYPRSNSEWGSFFVSDKANETLSIELGEPLKLIAGKDYRIELFYFVTEYVRLRLFTTASNRSIISLYPTYSYLPNKERFKYLPVSISLKDLLPFDVNVVPAGFSILIQTDFLITRSHPSDDPPTAAVSNIQITSGDFPHQNLTDFLAHWSTDGKRASNEWSCLVDQTSFYAGEQSFNNLAITFFAPKFRSTSTYLLLSKWSIENRQQFEIKITTELNSTLLIETIDEQLEVLNSKIFELDLSNENALSYEVMGNRVDDINSDKSIKSVKAINSENIKKRVIRLKLSFTLRNDDQPKKVTITDVNYGDPCSRPNGCLFGGECVSRSSTDYRCNCLPGHHGKRCEWPNRCATDPLYCGKQNATCTPISDSFKCNCAQGSFWLNDPRICQPLPYCYSKEHLRNQQCVYEYDYEGRRDCNEDQTFGCGQLFEPSSHIDCNELNRTRSSCLENEEKLVVSLASSRPDALGALCVCNRENGFFESRTSQTRCVQPTNETEVPFLRQFFSCSQTYKFSYLEGNSSDESHCKPECACWNGFELDGESKCTPTEECTLSCPTNQFCGFDENGTQTCLCDFGFFGENCKSNFCEANESNEANQANQELIRRFCGPFGCRATNFTGQVKFVCNCDEAIYESNSTTGLCQMRDVCAPGSSNDLDCRSKEAVCVPKLVQTLNGTLNDTQLTYDCRCPKGWHKDPLTGDCVQLCSVSDHHELTNQRCFASLALNSTEFLCKPGFRLDGNGVCVLSERENKYTLSFEARLNVDADVYEHFNRIKNHQLDDSNANELKIHEDCSTLLDPEGCVALMNRSYLQLEQRSNGLLINQSFVFSFSRLVNLSLQSVLGDDLFSSQVLHFQVLNDFSEEWVRDKEAANRTTRKNFKVLNFTVYLETNGFFEDLDENFLLNGCIESVCPLYPYLTISRHSFRVKRLVLNESDLLTECLPNSSPLFVENSNSLFRCVCDRGFRRLSKIALSPHEEYYKEICVDEDECATTKNDCDPTSTICVNLLGHYRCDCKTGLVRRDERSCQNASSICDLNTTTAFLLKNDYECRCKTDTLIKKDDFSCTDPCLAVRCEHGKCLPYRDSYVCAYVGNASSQRLSTVLLVGVCILISIRISARAFLVAE